MTWQLSIDALHGGCYLRVQPYSPKPWTWVLVMIPRYCTRGDSSRMFEAPPFFGSNLVPPQSSRFPLPPLLSHSRISGGVRIIAPQQQVAVSGLCTVVSLPPRGFIAKAEW